MPRLRKSSKEQRRRLNRQHAKNYRERKRLRGSVSHSQTLDLPKSGEQLPFDSIMPRLRKISTEQRRLAIRQSVQKYRIRKRLPALLPPAQTLDPPRSGQQMITIDLEDNEDCVVVLDEPDKPEEIQKDLEFKKKLIIQVRRNLLLYDNKHKLFSNVAKKDLVWQKIASKLNSSADYCKDTWFELRYRYQNHARRLRNYFADGHKENRKRPAMYLETDLMFLWRFIDNRKSCEIPFEIAENEIPYPKVNKKPVDDDLIIVEQPVELIVIDEDDDNGKSVKQFKMNTTMKSLVLQIKNYPELYDSNHSDFRNYTRKSFIWNAIASNLGDKATKLMKCWIVMETRYEWEICQWKQNPDNKIPDSELQVQFNFFKNFILKNPDTVYKQSYFLKSAWYDPIDYFKDIYNLIVRMKKMSDIVCITDALLKIPEKNKHYISLWVEIANLKNCSPGQCETTWLIMRHFYWELMCMRQENYQLTDKWYFETIITELYAISKAAQTAKQQELQVFKQIKPNKKANKRAAQTNGTSQGAPANKRISPIQTSTQTTTPPINNLQSLPASTATLTTQSISQPTLMLPKITAAISLAPQAMTSGALQIKQISGPPALSPAPLQHSMVNNTLTTVAQPSTGVPSTLSMSFNLPTQTKVTPIPMPALIRPLIPSNAPSILRNSTPTTTITVRPQAVLKPSPQIQIASWAKIPPTTLSSIGGPTYNTSVQSSAVPPLRSIGSTAGPKINVNLHTSANAIAGPKIHVNLQSSANTIAAPKVNVNLQPSAATPPTTITPLAAPQMQTYLQSFCATLPASISSTMDSQFLANQQMSLHKGGNDQNTPNLASTAIGKPIASVKVTTVPFNTAATSSFNSPLSNNINTYTMAPTPPSTPNTLNTIANSNNNANSNASTNANIYPNANSQLPKITGAISLLNPNEILIELIASHHGNQLVVHGPPLSAKYHLGMPTVAKFIREVLAIPLLHSKRNNQLSQITYYWDHISRNFNLPVHICRAIWNFLLENFSHFPQIAPLKELMKPFQTPLDVWKQSHTLFEKFEEHCSSKGWNQYAKSIPDVVETIRGYPALYQDVVRPKKFVKASEMETLCAWRTIALRSNKIPDIQEIWIALKACFIQYMSDLEVGIDNKWPSTWWRSLARMKFLVEARYSTNEPYYYIVSNKMLEEIDKFAMMEMRNRYKTDDISPAAPIVEKIEEKMDLEESMNTTDEDIKQDVELGALITAIQKHPVITTRADNIEKLEAWQKVAQELHMEVHDCLFAFKHATQKYFAYKKQDPLSRFRLNEKYYKKFDELVRSMPSSKHLASRAKINIKTPFELNQSLETDNSSELVFPERFISDISMSNSPSDLVVKNWIFALGNISYLSEFTVSKLKELISNIFKKL